MGNLISRIRQGTPSEDISSSPTPTPDRSSTTRSLSENSRPTSSKKSISPVRSDLRPGSVRSESTSGSSHIDGVGKAAARAKIPEVGLKLISAFKELAKMLTSADGEKFLKDAENDFAGKTEAERNLGRQIVGLLRQPIERFRRSAPVDGPRANYTEVSATAAALGSRLETLLKNAESLPPAPKEGEVDLRQPAVDKFEGDVSKMAKDFATFAQNLRRVPAADKLARKEELKTQLDALTKNTQGLWETVAAMEPPITQDLFDTAQTMRTEATTASAHANWDMLRQKLSVKSEHALSALSDFVAATFDALRSVGRGASNLGDS